MREQTSRVEMHEWKNREQITGVENAEVGNPYGKPKQYYTSTDPYVTS